MEKSEKNNNNNGPDVSTEKSSARFYIPDLVALIWLKVHRGSDLYEALEYVADQKRFYKGKADLLRQHIEEELGVSFESYFSKVVDKKEIAYDTLRERFGQD